MLKLRFIACAILPVICMTNSNAVTFYVSPSGLDSNGGTLARPFSTLARAQIHARKECRTKAVTVEIRGGTYYLNNPIEFTAADSGQPARPVVYQAYRGEKAVLSGAIPLSLHWSPYKNGIFQALVAPSGSSIPNIDQLFVNNELMHMARYPNYDQNAKYYHGTAANAISPARVGTWSDPIGGYVHALHQNLWGSLDYQITGKDGNGDLSLVGGWQNNRPAAMSDKYRFVENIFEELNAPGEWYLNHKTGVLYFMPPAGVNLSNATVAGTISNSLIEFRGTDKKPVSNITLNGLTFTQTSRTFMLTKEPLLRSDWRIYRGGVAFFTGAKHCKIHDCDFVDVGGNAVFLSGYNRDVSITGCKVDGAGASGICFVGSPTAVRSPLFQYDQSQPESEIDTAPGPLNDDYPSDCLAQDDLITRILRNTRWVCRHGWDIDLDDGATNYIIQNNLCLGGGIKNREGAYRIVENNILFDSTFHSHVWFQNSHDVFAHNIVMEPYQPIGMPTVWGSEIDYNLLPNEESLAQEQSAGHDVHSLCGDPMFENAVIGDFRVNRASPALKVGFVNFPMDAFGVTSPRLRAQSQNGFDFAIATQTNKSHVRMDSATHTWMGATVKSVTTVGEQSAAGLPEVRGVIIMDVPIGSAAAIDGLQNLDVIWAANELPVQTYEQLNAFKSANAPVKLDVYRNQRLISILCPHL
jgi:hypothetical protein